MRTILNELPRYEEDAGRRGSCTIRATPSSWPNIRRPTKSCGQAAAGDRRADQGQSRELDKAYDAERTAATVAWLLVLLTGIALVAAIAGLKFLFFSACAAWSIRRCWPPPCWRPAVACGRSWRCGNRPPKSRWPSKMPSTASPCSKPRGPRPMTPTATKAAGCCQVPRRQPDQIGFYADAFHKKAQDIAAYPGALERWPVAGVKSSTTSAAESARRIAGLSGRRTQQHHVSRRVARGREVAADVSGVPQIDEQIRGLDDEQRAVELCLGTQPGSRIGPSISSTRRCPIPSRSTRRTSNPACKMPPPAGGARRAVAAGLALAVSVLTFLGVRPRLNEYAGH